MKNYLQQATKIMLVFICFMLMTGCSKEKQPEKITVASLKGPTGMGMVQLMEEPGTSNYEFILSGTPDELVGKIINNEIDIACLPTNLASVLYNKTEGKVLLVGVNTLGSLYVLDNTGTIQSIQDLKGKTVYVSGQGATPDFVFRYLLSANGIDPEKDLEINFSMQHADLATAVAAKQVDIALLPQPYVTTVQMKNPEVKIALDLNDLWKQNSLDEVAIYMGCIVVQKDFAQKYPDALKAFIEEYKESVEWVNQNTVEAGVLIEKHGIIPNAKLAELAIPLSNIVYIEASEAEVVLDDYFNILLDFDAKSVGGKLPDEGFYYNPK